MAKFSQYPLSDSDTTQQLRNLVEQLNKEFKEEFTFSIDIPPIAPNTVKGTLTFKNGILTAVVLPS